ncbi:DHA2 family efflux MFS transporter permease subunit [Tomitella gaofuii]|uniref:DHA2 family efflux MFS transporter permease subunit n=1 Tax=Tomitella gaofuii TaxID=2760083 RepID=UPI0015FE38BE|nr:DHA2 family efflux MFS transporter permease subunit [Tomitella gaofuii]
MTTRTRTSPPASDERLSPSTRKTLSVLVFGGAAAILDSTVVTIALDRLTTALGTSTGTIQWVVTAYLLAVAVAVPMSGWAQARLGGKRAWIAALLVFVVASAACAASWNAGSLIAFRAFQGLGAGVMMPLMQTLAVQSVGTAGGKVMSKAVTAVTVPLALGPILGPVLGGVILSQLSWRWIFLINVPVVSVGVVLAWRMLAPDPPARDGGAGKLDVVGLSLLGPGLAGLVLGLSNLASGAHFVRTGTWLPLLGALALLVAFTCWSIRRRGRALVDVTLLSGHSLSVASIVLFTAGAVLYAGMVLLPLYWQQLRGATVLETAFQLIPMGVGALFARVIAARLAARIGPRWVTVGAFLVTAAGTVPFAFAGAHTGQWWLGAVLFVRGLGVGAVVMAPIMVAYADVPYEQMPHATMLTRITQQIGASFGAALVAVILQSRADLGAEAAFHYVFWWTTALTVLALIPALAFRRAALAPAREPDRVDGR